MKIKFTTLISGLILFSFFSKAQNPLFEQLTVNDGLGSNNVYSIVVTSEGEIWATTDKHLCLFQGIGFTNYEVKDSSVIGSFLDLKGNVWVYSSGGNLYKFNGYVLKKYSIGIEDLLATNLINEIKFESITTFWVSTIINGSLNKVVDDKVIPFELPELSGYFSKELNNGKFITGTGTSPNTNNELFVLFKNREVLKIPFTQKGLGTKSSLIVLKDSTFLFAKDFELIHFNKKQVINRTFVEKNITSLFQDSKNRIWVGLYNGGVMCYTDYSFSSKNVISYLGSNSITTIKEDLSGNIWVGTLNNGVYYLPNQQVVKYKPPRLFSDTGETTKKTIGIEVNETLDTSSIADLRVINTQSAIYDSIPPTIYFTSVKIMGRDTSIQKKYTLNYNQNFLNISYVGFSYKNPESIQYKYKMEGLDKGWTFTNNTTVQYTTLPPGKYKFIVSSMNKNGVWSENSAQIEFEISPPFWETWWFIISFLGSVLFLLFTVLYLWIRNIKNKERAKSEINKKIASIELQALRAQMNPHFMFNTMSSIQHYITINETESALRYLSKFSKLMRKILDNSKQPTITIKDELEALELYLSLEELRFKNKLKFRIDVDKSIDLNYDEIPAMLIQPYVENSILHGISHKEGQGLIVVSLSRENDFIKCTITDNGVGRKRSAEINKSKNKRHKSAGMSITKERLNILNQVHGSELNITITDLTNDNGENCGTKVEIYIPIES